MITVVAKRLFASIILLFLISALSFELIVVAPGDSYIDLRTNPHVSLETIETARRRAGSDLPAHTTFLSWLKNLARGDAGRSLVYDVPVGTLIWPRLGNTLILSLAAYLLAWALGLPLGILASTVRRRWIDRLAYVLATIAISLPRMFLALLAILFAARSRLLPIGGLSALDHDQMSSMGQLGDLCVHLALPTLVLSLYPMSLYFLQIRSSLSDALEADYVRTARSKGLRELRVVTRHALRNAINPLVTLFGYSIGNLLSGAALVETIMSWPGMGKLAVDAVFARDSYVILAVVLVSSIMLIIGNLIADLVLSRVDPRISLEA